MVAAVRSTAGVNRKRKNAEKRQSMHSVQRDDRNKLLDLHQHELRDDTKLRDAGDDCSEYNMFCGGNIQDNLETNKQ